VNRADFIGVSRVGLRGAIQDFDHRRAGSHVPLERAFPAEEVWDKLPDATQRRIINLGLKFYVINAYEVAKNTGMGGRINTIMQTCFFYLSNILPQDEAIAAIKGAIQRRPTPSGATKWSR